MMHACEVWRTACVCGLALLGSALTRAQGDVTATVDAFHKDIAAKAAAIENSDKMVIQGKDGWLFFGPELRSLSVGPFWGADAVKVSRASKAQNADPLPAILSFKAQLEKAGIELIMVPVPAKATIYPDMISDTVTVEQGQAPARFDVSQQAFYKLLADKGITVIDLTPVFLEHRFDKEGYLFCQQDTHWTGRACELTANVIAEKIKDRAWLKNVKKHKYEAQPQTVEITGDLWGMLGDKTLAKEKLPLTMVKERTAAGLVSPELDAKSPIIVLGDSHNLVFHDGADMLAQDAGFVDQFALKLGFPVDRVAVRGSGATPARMTLARLIRQQEGYMKGKKLLIWCFTAREFTESMQGWADFALFKQP